MLTRSLDPNDANADCKQKQKSKEIKSYINESNNS